MQLPRPIRPVVACLRGVAGLAAIAALMQVQPQWWWYDRSVLWQEPWRLLTGHVVHVGWLHWAMNMAALALVVQVFAQAGDRPWRGLLLMALLALLISLGLWFWHPALLRYAGASGVLHGLVAFGAMRWLAQPVDRRWGGVVLLGLLLKLGQEAWTGAAASAHWIGAPVVMLAHQLGAVVGVLMGLVWVFSSASHE